MSTKKSAALDGANIEDGIEKNVGAVKSSRQNEFNTGDGIRQEHFPIAELLPAGAENAVSSRSLAQMIGCSDVRQLQSMIAKERERGALILSTTTGGYFLPDVGEKGKQEIAAFVSALHARAINTLKAAAAARKALAVLDGQEALEDF